MDSAAAALAVLSAHLDDVGARWAVVGGLAVAFRSEPRFTKDVDVVVAVGDDTQAEAMINNLQSRGYAVAMIVEQEYVNRLGTVRLAPAAGGVFVDLLFVSSGIEPEIVAQAERVEIAPGQFVPVAKTAHLIAVKVLAGRNQDLTDLSRLLAVATDADIADARSATDLITARGFNRGEPLGELLSSYLDQVRQHGEL